MSYDKSLTGSGWVVGDINTAANGPTVYAAGSAGYPSGATPVAAQNAQADAQFVLTLPGVAGKTTYITGMEMTGTGATAAKNLLLTLAGVLGGSTFYSVSVPAGVNTPTPSLVVTFNPPLPASAPNTAITLTVPTFGTGNVVAAAAIRGFQV